MTGRLIFAFLTCFASPALRHNTLHAAEPVNGSVYIMRLINNSDRLIPIESKIVSRDAQCDIATPTTSNSILPRSTLDLECSAELTGAAFCLHYPIEGDSLIRGEWLRLECSSRNQSIFEVNLFGR